MSKKPIRFQAGAGREIITPPIGTTLYGYEPGRPALSVGDDLNAIAAAFRSGDTAIIMIAADIATVPAEICDPVRQQVADATGVPLRNITFSATHTHSGPYTFVRDGEWAEKDRAYLEGTLIPQSVKAGVQAYRSLRPALFGIGTTHSDVGVNRRELLADGTVILGQCPWGVMDPIMTVLSCKDAETGEIILNMIHYGAHGTASWDNPEITRDWPGPMKDMLERECGGITMFVNGSEGETGPRCPNGKTTQDYRAAMDLGRRAGFDAIRAWKTIKDWHDPELRVVYGKVTIPYQPLGTRESLLAEMARLGTKEQIKAEGRIWDMFEYRCWESKLEELEKGQPKTEFSFDQSILAIGTVAFVPFPYEMFMDMTLRLRRFSKFSHTLCLSNCNGANGYLPSQDQLCRGGYEIWAFKYDAVYALAENADTFMVTENLKLLDEAYDL